MKIVNIVLVITGFICIGVGTIGILIPVLPTTPFYLLALACFARGSARFHRWFASTKLYQRHLESFVQNRSMTVKAKISILLPVTIMLILAAILIDVLAMRIVIAALILLKYWYFTFRIRTVRTSREADSIYAGAEKNARKVSSGKGNLDGKC